MAGFSVAGSITQAASAQFLTRRQRGHGQRRRRRGRRLRQQHCHLWRQLARPLRPKLGRWRGGNGGFSVAGSIASSGGNVGAGIGGSGSGGGSAQTVTVTAGGAVLMTAGTDADGILAQSIRRRRRQRRLQRAR
ncbi:MAG: hypothetical protein WDM77_21990 [Steroidobacteraceae bacterium]